LRRGLLQTEQRLMGLNSFLEQTFLGKSAKPERDVAWEEKLNAALNFADYQDEQAVHRFTVAWQSEIDATIEKMKAEWPRAKEIDPNFTVDQFWEVWTEHSKEVRQINTNDPNDKLIGKILNMVDRMAWSLWRMQLLRQAGLPITS